MAYEIKAGLRLRFKTVKFLDDAGKPEPVENPGATSSDPTVAGAAFIDGELVVTRIGVGHASITVYADADTSEATQEINTIFDVFCPPVQATKIDLGEPTTEPDNALGDEQAASVAAVSGADTTIGAPATEVEHPADSAPVAEPA